MPAWLTERLREDAEQEAERQRKRLLARRALVWSAAATIVAMLAAGGYWFYQESRVEGALNVVADTRPAAPASLAAPGTSRASVVPVATPPAALPDTPAISETARNAVQAATPGAAAAQTGAPATSDAPAHGVKPFASVQPTAAAADAAAASLDRRSRASAATAHHKRPQAESHARSAATERADSEPTPAQRREETLMQCRVLGYDEQECSRRGCMMTRFGLACPG